MEKKRIKGEDISWDKLRLVMCKAVMNMKQTNPRQKLDRDRTIYKLRMGLPPSDVQYRYSAIGREFGISGNRVKQICDRMGRKVARRLYFDYFVEIPVDLHKRIK